jgi:N-methylhydantoinase A
MMGQQQSDARFRIAVDTGGTFTDVVVSGNDGSLAVGKALTTPSRVFEGFKGAVERAAELLGHEGAEVLRAADVIVYGTTHATNAVLTGRTARTAFLVTEGFGDTLLLREGGRRDVFDARVPYPGPYVPRRLTFELRERVSAEGEILTELDESHAREVLRSLRDDAVEAIAVMLLWSIANDVHERRVGELIEEELPGIPYTLSVQANPALREYRRASAAAIDASLKPLMRAHLGDLSSDLTAAGFQRDFMVVTSEGAVLDAEDVADRPVLAINSGPSMAPLVGAAAAPESDVVVVCDMGGTTFDVSLVERGRVRHTREGWLGEPFIGHLTGLSSVAVKSIGAGGGSIASIDPGGLLRVGPQSAGSTPGPAAYGRGGELPTVTDAAVALGYLRTDGFEGGFDLDRAAAERAIATHVGERLGMSVVEAAQAILDVSINHLASAIRQATLEEGVDPRGALIVAGGGAGPMVAAMIAELLDSDRALVPATAGVLAAFGAHEAAIATEFGASLFVDTSQFDGEAVAGVLDRLDTQAEAFLTRFREPDTEPRVSYFVDARYPAQAWELRVHFDSRPDSSSGGGEAIEQAFHAEHLQRNGIEDRQSRVEVVSWGVRAELTRLGQRARKFAQSEERGPYRTDEIIFGSRSQPVPRYLGGGLTTGTVVEGPAVIDEPTTTLVVPPHWRVRLDGERNFRMERNGAAA